jgi:hypothetical protein
MGNRGLRKLGYGWRAKLAVVLTLALLISVFIVPGVSTAQQEAIYLSSELSMFLDANDPIDPRNPIDTPVCTDWHELYPDFCNGYHLSDWEDNNDGILSRCDQIELTDDVTGKKAWYHVDAVTITIWVVQVWPVQGVDTIYLDWNPWKYDPDNPYDPNHPIYSPVCTYWHEIYPEFCNWYHLLEVEDNGDQVLSYCDNIWLVDIRTGEGGWYHVEGITTDMVVSPKPRPPDPIPNPVCTYWHEIYPEFCKWHHLSDWDDNTDGVLSPCDSIELTDLATQEADWFHVDEVTLTIWVTKWTGQPLVPEEDQVCLEFEAGYDYMEGAMVQPICTDWHEIYPEFCNRFHIDDWIDNGDDFLSFCDWILLRDLVTQATAWCHVDEVATNIIITPTTAPVTEYTLTVSSTAGGSVTSPGEDTFTYQEGTVVNLVAAADDGYEFTKWTGGVATIADVNAATITITMNGDYSITANFEEEAPGPACFIATAAYGTPMVEEIEILREFRDEYLLTNPVGKSLVDFYYSVSPPIAEFIAEHPSLKPIVRASLVPVVAMSTVAVNTSPAEKATIIGLVVLVSVALAFWATRRRGRGSEYT